MNFFELLLIIIWPQERRGLAIFDDPDPILLDDPQLATAELVLIVRHLEKIKSDLDQPPALLLVLVTAFVKQAARHIDGLAVRPHLFRQPDQDTVRPGLLGRIL